ncbi:oligosaccharide flippase family protein [Mucilaginibacter sp. AW1-3]
MQLPGLSDLKNKHVLALLGNFVIAAVSFGMVALLAHKMQKGDLGIWFYFLMIYGFADSVRNGLLTTATIKFYAGTTPERAREVLGSVWLLALGLTGLLVLANAAALPFIHTTDNKEVQVLIQWFGLTVLSSLPFNVTFWIMVADNDYGKILWLRLVNNGCMIITIGILAFLHQATLEHILLVNFLTNVLTSLICLALGYSKFTSLFKSTRVCTKELFDFGKFSLASNMSSYLLGMVNGQIVNSMLTPAALADYVIGTKLMEVVEIPLRSFVGTGMSAMATAYNNNNMYHLTFVSKKYAGMLTLVFVPMAIIAFFGADLAILILGGKDYVHSAAPNILRMMMFIAILYPIDRFNGVTLDIINQPKVNLYKVITMGTVNIAVAFVATLFLKNAYGVVIATLFATLAGITVGYYHLRKHIDYSLRGIIFLGVVELKNFFNEKIMKRPPANTTPQI